MNRCLFLGALVHPVPLPHHLVIGGSLIELHRPYASMHRRIIRCWRPCGQNLTISFHKTIGLTAAEPSVHPVLLHWSWCVSILFKPAHQIDRQFLPIDRRFIRRFCLPSFISAIRSMQLEPVTPDFTRKTECISRVRQDHFTHTW
jgi:hypothetical protein